MKFSAVQIAELLGGTVEGDKNVLVDQLSKIEEGVPGSLSFLSNPLYIQYIYTTKASVVIVANDFKPDKPVAKNCTMIRVEDPYASFGKLLEVYDKVRHNKTGIDPDSTVSESAKLGKDVYVGSKSYIGENVQLGDNTKVYPGVYIGDNTKIGEDCILYPGVRIYHDCILGNKCIIHSGTVIGSDGFGFSPNNGKDFQKLPQIGNAILEDLVEIGANSTIDRATMGSTIIRRGVKIDNLVQVGHNAEIGENTIIVAQTGIAGSAKIGKNCMIGGQVGIVGHITVGDNVKVAGQSGVGADVPDGSIIQGSPAFSISEYKRSYVNFKNLPKLSTRLNDLERAMRENQIEENE